MRHDPIGGLLYSNIVRRFADFVVVAQEDTGDVVECAYSVPSSRSGVAPCPTTAGTS